MKAQPKFTAWISILLLMYLFPTTTLYSTEISQKDREKTYQKLELFSNILSILQENYVEDLDTAKAIDGAINGLLLSLDPHSSYLTPESFKELQDETQGSFTGIGIEITIKKGKLTVVSPIEDTPAYKAGIKANDIIVKINKEWTKDMSPMEAIKKLRGPEGSEVSISIHRKGWEDLQEIKLIRALIPVHSVRSFFLEPGLAYTRITNFQSHTTKDYKEAIDTLEKTQKINGLILDLRNNPGGLLNQAVSIADLFLNSGLIVYTKGRTKDQNMVFKAHKLDTRNEFPLVVIVNEGSASAAEIVAGAIQDHGRGLLIGKQTFGKGSVQTIVPLQGGAGLRMTTARYYTPKGRSIQAKGIIPDVEVSFLVSDSLKESDKKHNSITREKDLRNHFMNITQEVKTSTEETPLVPPQTPEEKIELEVAEKLQADNQLRMALNILKGVTLLSSSVEESGVSL